MLRDLSQEPLDDLLLSLSEEEQSVDLFFETARGPARLRLHRGRLVDAEWDKHRGAAALRHILDFEEGRVEVRDNTGNEARSFDVGVAEALITRPPSGRAASLQGAASSNAAAPSDGSFESTTAESTHAPTVGGAGRFARTVPGLFPSTERRTALEPKTLRGFPAGRVRQVIESRPPGQGPSAKGSSEKDSSGASGSSRPPAAAGSGAPPAAAAVRTTPPRRLLGPDGQKPSGTGYSSAPPPDLAEEHVVLPRALSTPGTSGGNASGASERPFARTAISGSNPPTALRPFASTIRHATPLDAAVARRLGTRPGESRPDLPLVEPDTDNAPVSSLQLDRRSLDRLEALHEGLSNAGHAIPERPGDLEEDWPAEHGTSPGGSPPSERPQLPRVGRYEVLARLKSGGMGSVYLCRLSGSAGFRRLFAMKVLHQNLAEQEDTLELFFREASLLAQLHHPNIVGIVDVGSVQQPYLVLDYVEGGSLQEVLLASPDVRHPGVIVAIVLDALNGLASAHELTDESGRSLGLVHNDVSPHNLLVGVDGTCRVTDFGVAKARDAGADRPESRGKPSYMAPERIRGEESDQRADLFSLGVVLYTALTGVNPFSGASAEETLENVLSKPVLPPSEVGLRPPPCLDWVCMKALARNPAERFQSAEEMATQLRRVVAREDLLVAPSVVATWVRTVLASTLDARRAAALKGISPEEARNKPSAFPPGVIVPGLSMHPTGHLSSEAPPPSSNDFNERTEVLGPSAKPPAPADQADRRRKLVIYLAVGLAAIAFAWVILFPDKTAGFLKRDATEKSLTVDEAYELQKRESERAPEPEDEPVGEKRADDTRDKPAPETRPVDENEIHVPDIKPRERLR